MEDLDQSISDKQARKLIALGKLAAHMSHELKGPLSALAGYASLSEEALYHKQFEELHDYIERILSLSSTLNNIVQGVAFFSYEEEASGADAGTSRPDGLKTERVSVSKIVQHTVTLCHETALPIEVKLPKKEVFARCHATSLAQVLANLLNNAKDAVRAGHREPWIQVKLSVHRHSLEIAVCDSGPGIPADIADHIMKPFFTTKERGKGSGLGLSISRSLMEKLGGTLSLDRNGPCTRFVISLPNKE